MRHPEALACIFLSLPHPSRAVLHTFPGGFEARARQEIVSFLLQSCHATISYVPRLHVVACQVAEAACCSTAFGEAVFPASCSWVRSCTPSLAHQLRQSCFRRTLRLRPYGCVTIGAIMDVFQHYLLLELTVVTDPMNFLEAIQQFPLAPSAPPVRAIHSFRVSYMRQFMCTDVQFASSASSGGYSYAYSPAAVPGAVAGAAGWACAATIDSQGTR